MMKNLVPVTKLIGTFAFSFWALVMHTTLPLVILVVIELILLGLCGSLSRNLKAGPWNRLMSRACACWP